MSFLNRKNKVWLLVIAAVLIVTFLPSISAATNQKLRVTVGQSTTHQFANTIKTVSIANSDIADVIVAGPREVLINGKSIGLTTLVVWDQNNVSAVFDVVVRGPFSDQKIELRVKVAEINRTRAFELGFDFLYKTEHRGDQYTGGTFGGSVSDPSVPLSIFDGIPTPNAQGIFRWVSGSSELQSMVTAALTNGVLHVLAEPTVIAASGEEAEFLSGGEIPVPIATAGVQGGSAVTIEWKEFGVKVKFIPTIVDSNVINLYVAPSVSSLDYSNGVEISGFTIPALRTRKAVTTVELMDGETLVIGGLIQEETIRVRTRIPLLGHIPLLGYLFSSVENRTSESELVLVVTPHLVRALPPGTEVELPMIDEEGKDKRTK